MQIGKAESVSIGRSQPSEDDMSLELELLSGSQAPRLDVDNEDKKRMVRAAHVFSSVPTEYNLESLQEAVGIMEAGEVSEAETKRFSEYVASIEAQRIPEPPPIVGSEDDD